MICLIINETLAIRDFTLYHEFLYEISITEDIFELEGFECKFCKNIALYQAITMKILYNIDWQRQLALLEWSSPWTNHERKWTYSKTMMILK